MLFATPAVVLWILLCWTLSAHWLTNPQYSYGLIAPMLAAFLFWRRWDCRPDPRPAPAWTLRVLLVLLLTFAPLWLVAQPNPEWRLLGWLLGLTVCTYATGTMLALGGRQWALHFAFPAAFMLSAVPWPSAIEIPVVLGLMRVVAVASADLLNLMGIAAVAVGNVIELKNGTLGVDEACSGVRSLQSSIMAALFLGELYMLRGHRRAALVGVAAIVAFLCNIGRATFLGMKVHADGLGAVSKYHDPAGFTVLTICFLLVWIVALWMNRREEAPEKVAITRQQNVIAPAWSVGFLVWIAITFAAVEWWYGGAAPHRGASWTFTFPEKKEDYRTFELPSDTISQLQPDKAQCAAWSGTAGKWLAFHFQWNSGTNRSRILAVRHKPEGCLPATGWTLEEERAPIEFPIGDANLVFRALTFKKENERTHVYFAVWQETADGRQSAALESPRQESMRLVWSRERALGQQILEIILSGPDSAADADKAFRAEVAPLLEKR